LAAKAVSEAIDAMQIKRGLASSAIMPGASGKFATRVLYSARIGYNHFHMLNKIPSHKIGDMAEMSKLTADGFFI